MLRVTIHDSSSELRLHLEGKLAGPWVREVELCWQTAQSVTADRTVTVDLRDVDFVDSAGERVLAAMHEQGVRLLAGGLMTQGVVSKITGGAEERRGANLLPRRLHHIWVKGGPCRRGSL